MFALDLLGANPALLDMLDAQLTMVPDAGAMDADGAERYVWGVRMYGASHWNGEDGPGALPPREPERAEAP